MHNDFCPEGRCPRVLRGNARLGSQWVLSGFSVGSQKMNIFQEVDKNSFHKKRGKKLPKKKKKGQALMGARLGSQWVLSGFSVSSQRVLSEYSGFSVGSQTVHF